MTLKIYRCSLRFFQNNWHNEAFGVMLIVSSNNNSVTFIEHMYYARKVPKCLTYINLFHAYKKSFWDVSFIPLLEDEKQWGTEVDQSHLTKVTCLVEQGSGFKPMPWVQEPDSESTWSLISPVLSNSNICRVLFLNFSSLILDLCKDMVMFVIISTPGKIIYFRTWNSVEGWVCEELEQVGKYWSGQVLSVDVVFWGREKSLVGKRIQEVLFFLRLFTWERVGMWSRQGQREWERESWPDLLSAEPDGELHLRTLTS